MAGLLLTSPAAGQAVYGSVFGTVTDPSGAAVPRASIVVTSVERAGSIKSVTNDSGNYKVAQLVPGHYMVKAEAPGFRGSSVTDVPVHVDQASRVDLKLPLGMITEGVTVSAKDLPLLKTDRTDVAVTFSEREILDVPLKVKNNFTSLELLAPGTSVLGWQHASSENPQGSIQINVNGQNWSQTTYQLDGTDNRDPLLGIIVINPNLEAVTETKFTTQNYDPEFDGIAGVMSTQTKSGTNRFHGSLAPGHSSATNLPFIEVPSIHIPSDNIWSLAASLGGPIVKNRVFFFADYAGDRDKRGASGLFSVPTDQVRRTCLDPRVPSCDLSEYPTQIYDPATGNSAQFRDSQIPRDRISPQAVKLLDLLPAPNVPGALFNQNYLGTGVDRFQSDRFDVRLDHALTQKVQYFARYSFADFRRHAATAYGDQAGGIGMIDGFPGSSFMRNQSVAVGSNYAFSNSLLADVRFGFFRYHVNVFPSSYGSMPAADAGIPNINFDRTTTSGMPYLQVDGQGGGNFTFGSICNCPLLESEQQFQWVTNWTKTHRNHTIKWGADMRYAQNLRVSSDGPRAGGFSFANTRTQGPGQTGGGSGLASMLLGDATFFGRTVSSTTNAGERQQRWFLYAQDAWRITRKLTFTYGLRWDLVFPQSVTGKGKGGWLDVNTGEISVAGYEHNNLQGGVRKSFDNVAPRIGIIYSPNPKTVLRIGYGRSFDIGVFGSNFGHTVTQNLPVLAKQAINPANVTDAVFTLTKGPPAPNLISVPPSGRFKLPDQVQTYGLLDRVHLPTVDAWNVALQRAITPTLSLEASYVANKGTHVFPGDGPSYDLNQPSIEGFGRLNLFQRRPLYQKFGWTQPIIYFGGNANNTYNALQVLAVKRFGSGYEFQSHYTWSKALGYNNDYYNIDPGLNYGPSDSNRKHVFVLENVIDLPFGRHRRFLRNINRWQDWILGGWTLAGATTMYSGLPFTPTYLNCSADIDTGPCRPNLVGKVHVTGSRFQYFTTTGGLALQPFGTPGDTVGPWQRPAPGSFGSVGRNSLSGPGFANTDIDVKKSFTVKGDAKLEMRMWIGNVFHKLNLGNPIGCVDCLDGGKIYAGDAARSFGYDFRFQF